MSERLGKTEFRAGDVIQLKSGGPPMTVRARNYLVKLIELPNSRTAIQRRALWGYWCEWFENEKVKSHFFCRDSVCQFEASNGPFPMTIPEHKLTDDCPETTRRYGSNGYADFF